MSNILRKKIKLFDMLNIIFMLVMCFVVIYPLWYSIVFSLNDAKDLARNGLVYFWPRMITFENYTVLFADNTIIKAFGISIARTIIGTVLHVFFTAMVSYGLIKKELPGRKIFLTMGTISMFFGGGLIPYYLLIQNLGLVDNFLVFIIPGMFLFYDALIFMGFFRTIPDSIEESAKIDGANDIYIFIKLILPLSTPVLATITIFNGVGNWNDFFTGFIFINRNLDITPVMTFLYQMVSTTEAYSRIPQLSSSVAQVTVTPEGIRVAIMIVTAAPIIIVYPFLQKYFTKGLMLGAVKG